MHPAHRVYPLKTFGVLSLLFLAALTDPAIFAHDVVVTSSPAANDQSDFTRPTKNALTRDSDNAPANSVTHADRHFIEKAVKSGQTEARMAELAADRASDPAVKAFAQQMYAEHQKTNIELTQLAERKGISVLDPVREDHNFKRLSDKTGAEFDRRFIGHMVDDHEDAIEIFQKGIKSNDTDITAFATKTLSTLQEHLRQARELEAALKR